MSTFRVGAAVAVSDMRRAKDFYEGTLGLEASGDDPDGGRTYECGGKTTLHIFPSPAGAGRSGATVAGWTVDDLERMVAELAAKGVTFERHHEPPIVTDERGIAVIADSKGAWFKDPDGNILGLIEPQRQSAIEAQLDLGAIGYLGRGPSLASALVSMDA